MKLKTKMNFSHKLKKKSKQIFLYRTKHFFSVASDTFSPGVKGLLRIFNITLHSL